MPFQKGQKANPHGRPKGSKNKITETREKVYKQIQSAIPEVVAEIIAQAKDGCRISQKLLIERYIPTVSQHKVEHTTALPTLVIQQITQQPNNQQDVIETIVVDGEHIQQGSKKKKEIPNTDSLT